MPPRATLMMADGVLGLGDVDADEVGQGHQPVEVHQLDVDLAGPFRGDERVVGDQPHPEGRRPLGDQLADAPEADDPQRLVGELHALPASALPPAVRQRRVRLRHVTCLSQQQRHRVLGRGQDVGLRGIDDHHAPLGGVLHVDVVQPDPRPAHDHEIGAGIEDVGRHLGGGPDDQRVGAGNGFEQCFR
jgi:hypothetical protein